VTFIPKPGKPNYTDGRSYHPITVSSFLLKTMNKLVDRYIRDTVLRNCPLTSIPVAYQGGNSTETTLHNIIIRIYNVIKHKEIALGAFLEIEGAFDRTSIGAIVKAANRHGVEPTICR
jgi:hypothetical protein